MKAVASIDSARLLADALANASNRVILERLPQLELPDAWLVAGCLFQSVWNQVCGRAPERDILDYDLFYFDATDLSAATEQAVGQRVQTLNADLGVTIEAKNQARVHTWYETWFGRPYAPLRNTRDGIDHFLVRCTCIGIAAGDAGLELYAPNGLDDLYAGVLQPNPLCDHPELFQAKTASYRARWPWLSVRP